MNMQKMAAWKKENEKSLAEKEQLRKIQLEKDNEMIVQAKLAVEEAERKREKELEVLKAKMQVMFPRVIICGQSCSPSGKDVGIMQLV